MSLQIRGSGGGAVNVKKKASEGCQCTPDPHTGKCCATNRCGCRKKGEDRAGGYCSKSCMCHRPLCACEGNHTSIELTVKKMGPNTGRKFFKCRKREGGCNYFQWATPPLQQQPGRKLGAGAVKEEGAKVIDLVSDDSDSSADEDDKNIRSADSNPAGYFRSPCVNQFGSRGADALAPAPTKYGGEVLGRSPVKKPGGGGGRGGKKRKRCSQGRACPYQHEYQHQLEFSHSDDEDAAPGGGIGGGFRKKPGGGGGGGGKKPKFTPFAGAGNKLGGIH